jgi:flagellar biosynthesis protein FlhF
MRIQKFAAKDMPDAMRQIRREIGPEAIILHQRQFRDGGFWKTFKRPGVEVLAAVNTDLPATPPLQRPQIRPVRQQSRPSDTQALVDIQRTVGEVHEAIARLETMTELPSQVSYLGENLAQIYQNLLHQEVTRELAHNLVHQVFKELSPQALENEPTVRSQVKAQMERQLRVVDPLRVVPGKTRTIFVIGPTGVGKTTTLAKLAANFALNEQRRVALLTTDTYRIAAIPQLRTYGEIMGLTLDVAYSPSELQDLVLRHQDKDIVLVDTPGRSQHNQPMLEEMVDFMRAVPSRTLYLAVSAASKYRDMLDVVNHFGTVSIDGIIITKLDETVSFGPILNLASEVGLLLAYYTNGQDVPADIEIADSRRIVDLILDQVPASAQGSGL